MSLRWTGCTVFAMLLVCGPTPRPVAALHEAGKPDQANTAAEPAPEELALGPRKWRGLRKVERLRDAIFERINLTPRQKADLAVVFARAFQEAHENPRWWAPSPRPYPTLGNKERAELERQLATAEKAGDHKAAEKIRFNIAKGTVGATASLPPSTQDVLIADLTKCLNPDQVDAFNATVERWRVLESRLPRDGPLRMLRRALADPDLGLSAEVHQKVDGIMERAYQALPSSGKRTPESKSAAAKGARAEILAIVDSKQKAIVEAHLAQFARQQAERERFRALSNKVRRQQIETNATSPADKPTKSKKDD